MTARGRTSGKSYNGGLRSFLASAAPMRTPRRARSFSGGLGSFPPRSPRSRLDSGRGDQARNRSGEGQLPAVKAFAYLDDAFASDTLERAARSLTRQSPHRSSSDATVPATRADYPGHRPGRDDSALPATVRAPGELSNLGPTS